MRANPFRITAGVVGGAIALLALAGPAPAAAPRGTSYGGAGTAEDAVVFLLSPNGGRVTRAALMVDVTCDSGRAAAVTVLSGSPVGLRPSGAFTFTDSGTAPISGGVLRSDVSVKARATGRRIRGTATVRATIVAPDGATIARCSGTSRFTARSQPGRVFAGITTQGAPVVVEIVPSGVMVKHFHIGWTAGCDQNLYFSLGDTVVDFSIVGGRFGNRFTGSYNSSDGYRLSYRYDVRGRITGARVNGTFRQQDIIIDPEGGQVECDTGTVTYRATSG